MAKIGLDDMCKDVSRLEVIDSNGRQFVKYFNSRLFIDFQDNGKTMKVFIQDKLIDANSRITAEDFFDIYKKWSTSTFGNATPMPAIAKLLKEVEELQKSSYDITEGADVLMCLFHWFACAYPDKPLTYLLEAANKKLAVNMSREWFKQPDGTWQHIKK